MFACLLFVVNVVGVVVYCYLLLMLLLVVVNCCRLLLFAVGCRFFV